MYRKIIVILICILLFGAIVVSGNNIQMQDVEKNGRGNTLYVGGSGQGNYTKIQDAIDDASDGDTVFVYDDRSPYCENLNVTKSISLIGEDRDTTVIDGDFKDNTILVESSFVNINNFKVVNSIIDYYSAGIYVWKNGQLLTDISIINCVISNGEIGIRLTDVKSCFVLNCSIYNNNKNSLYAINSDDTLIMNFIIYNNGFLKDAGEFYSGGIDVTGDCENVDILNCHIYNNIGFGINSFLGNQNITIYNNTITGSYHGIYIASTDNLNVYNNIVYKNDEFGIYILGVDNGFVYNNMITENGDVGIYDAGVYVQLCFSGVIIKNNDISSNKKYGIIILNSSGNIISRNNFIDNEKGAFFIYKTFQGNIWLKNYWNRPRFLPMLIFGLISKNVWFNWFNIDWRPALKLYDI
jgi:parallel beta-helix repeat protein